MIYYQKGSQHHSLTQQDLEEGLVRMLEQVGPVNRVLLIPPDQTRHHSRAGEITRLTHSLLKNRISEILPALGTHHPMTSEQLDHMFPGIPHSLFRVHDWRRDVMTVGEVPGAYISAVTEGALSYAWPVQLNQLVWRGKHELILSIGQVVPHEVVGMANYDKNILIGCGGPDAINKSHFLGAVAGMEKIMGRADNPVRKVLQYANDRYLSGLPIIYVLTVIGNDHGKLVTRGLFIGDDPEVFKQAAQLSLEVNFISLPQPQKRMVVYLDPSEYPSCWLGNKSIYRTRMAMADNGELIILAPGVQSFGEDPEIDRLIRKFGYQGTPEIMRHVDHNEELRKNLSAASHLIHGSSEGRFHITYCPGGLSQNEIESVGFHFGDLKKQLSFFSPDRMEPGINRTPTGEAFYFVNNPGLGLWTDKNRFDESSS